MVASVLVLVLLLQIKHLFADFFWQTKWMVANKGRYGHPGGIAHAAVHGAATGIILWGFMPHLGWPLLIGIVLGEMGVHYHIDWVKERLTRGAGLNPGEKRFWDIAGTDQALHQATYLAIAALVFA